MDNAPNFLEPKQDGLAMRESNEYARDKLYALEAYLHMARISMKHKPWYAFNYIDLQAGPGKNRIGDKIFLGSPLIALAAINPPFDHYWFNELNTENFNALRMRISGSPYASSTHVYQQDVNAVVDEVVGAITQMDIAARYPQWSTFNVAFLDPEGLEINWDTVRKLAQIRVMDLIINFSTNGIIRNLHQPEILDRFFGNPGWRQSVTATDPQKLRRQLIEVYRKQLKEVGYHIADEDSLEHYDISMRNRKNAEVYSLIFASKNPLGSTFWKSVSQMIDKLRHGSERLF